MTYDQEVTSSDAPAASRAPTPDQPPLELVDVLRRSLMHAVRRVRQERSSVGISDTQYQALACLMHRGPMSPTALAEEQRIAPPPMTRAINGLAEAGYVAREEHPTDKRQVVVSITAEGEHEVAETRRRRNAWLAGRLADLPPADLAVLARAAELLEEISAR